MPTKQKLIRKEDLANGGKDIEDLIKEKEAEEEAKKKAEKEAGKTKKPDGPYYPWDETGVSQIGTPFNEDVIELDASDIVVTESMSNEFVLSQLLDKNGFEITNENMIVLAKAIKNGSVILK